MLAASGLAPISLLIPWLLVALPLGAEPLIAICMLIGESSVAMRMTLTALPMTSAGRSRR